MRAFSSSLAASRKRIKKAHKKTKQVSAIYALASLLLTVLAFFPTINIQFAGKDKLFIGTFFWPIVNIFKGKTSVLDLIVMLAYIVMLVLLLINFFKCISRFGKIIRRNSGNVTTCNKNLLIMEEAGNAFSASFAIYVIFNFAIYMISYAVLPAPKLLGPITLWALIALAVAILAHLLAGVMGAGVSVFIIGSTIEEKKREDKIFPFFLRNLIQLIAIIAILYFFVPATNLYIEIDKLLGGEASVFTNIGGDLFAFLAVVLQVLVIVMMAFLIKHATATTEYNLIGMDGPGMFTFRIFGLITGALCVALFIFDTTDGSHINYLVAGVIAIVAAIADFIIKPRAPKVVEDDPALRKLQENPFIEAKTPDQQQPVAQPAANCCLYARPCYPGGVQQLQQAQQPVNEQAEQEKPQTAQPVAPAGNTYYTMVNGRMMPVNANMGGVPGGLPAGLPPQGAPTVMDVKCPSCGKPLSIKDSVAYHRCPSCGKVFQIRKGKKMGGQPSAPAEDKE